MQRTSFVLMLSIAFILSLSMVAVCMASAQAIYSGRLTASLPYGTTFILASAGVLIILISSFSGLSISIARPQDEPLPLIIIMVQFLTAHFSSGQEAFMTVLVNIVLTTFLTGTLLYLFGYFRLGRFVRYVPFPVVAGFLSSTGLLLILSGIHQVIPLHMITWQTLTLSLEPNSLLLWIPSLSFGVVLFLASERYNHPLLLPGLITLGLVLFYLCVFFSGVTFSSLKSIGLLLDVQNISMDQLLAKIHFANPIEWQLIRDNLGEMFIIAIVSGIALLFITMSLELILNDEIDFNKELRVAGLANIVASFFGGIVGYHGLSNTVFVANFKISSRIVGIVCGLSCFFTMTLADKTLNYFPRFMLVGLIIFLGISLFYKWTFCIRSKLDLLEKAVVILVLLVTVVFGFLQGMVTGVIISSLFFIYTYSRVNVIRYAITGQELTSSYEREPFAKKMIKKHSDRILYFKLQGYLFFGSSNALVDQLAGLLLEKRKQPIQFVIYDVDRVSGFDSSVEMSFKKIKRYAREYNLIVIITGFAENRSILLRERIAQMSFNEFLLAIPQTDDAIDYCETAILRNNDYTFDRLDDLYISLESFLGDPSLVDRIPKYFEDIKLAKGQYLVHQNELSHDLFYLVSGELSIFIEFQDGSTKLISRIGPGNIIGEIAFYLHSKRSASIIAEKKCLLKKLTQKELKRMKNEDIDLSDAFDKAIIYLLSTKLIDTTHIVRFLSK